MVPRQGSSQEAQPCPTHDASKTDGLGITKLLCPFMPSGRRSFRISIGIWSQVLQLAFVHLADYRLKRADLPPPYVWIVDTHRREWVAFRFYPTPGGGRANELALALELHMEVDMETSGVEHNASLKLSCHDGPGRIAAW